MADYRVSFFKNLVSSDGHRFKCLQCVIEVRDSASPAQAIETASREFELRHGLCDWKCHADLVEVVATDQAGRAGERSTSRPAAA